MPERYTWINKTIEDCPEGEECMWWKLETTPAEYLDLEVLKDTRKLKNHEWTNKEIKVQRSILNGAKHTEWTQVICSAQVNGKFALELKMKLLDAGFDHGSETTTLDGKTK